MRYLLLWKFILGWNDKIKTNSILKVKDWGHREKLGKCKIENFLMDILNFSISKNCINYKKINTNVFFTVVDYYTVYDWTAFQFLLRLPGLNTIKMTNWNPWPPWTLVPSPVKHLTQLTTTSIPWLCIIIIMIFHDIYNFIFAISYVWKSCACFSQQILVFK